MNKKTEERILKYIRFSVLTTTEAEDFISAMLHDLGAEGVEIENNVPLTKEELEGMFVDFPPDLSPDDGSSIVSFYMPEETDREDMLRRIYDGIEEQRQFVDVGPGTVTVSETEDADWMNNWKQYFHSFSIGDVFIKPTWEELPEEAKGKRLIEIDPGISFGTGKHETTQLCIKALMQYLKKGDLVLDVGCGSGILSIAALKLGAAHVVGTDIDEACMTSTAENFAVNHLAEEQGEFFCGNLIDDESLVRKIGGNSFDIICANILADVIIPLAPVIWPMLKKNGIFITSGIIDFKEQEVKKALAETGFTILDTGYQGEWVSFVAKKEQ